MAKYIGAREVPWRGVPERRHHLRRVPRKVRLFLEHLVHSQICQMKVFYAKVTVGVGYRKEINWLYLGIYWQIGMASAIGYKRKETWL
jgi:hypothetical protein